MAARVFLLSVVCTLGLIAGRTIGLELGLGVRGEPGDIVVGRGKSLTLPCAPTHPANISWTLNGQPLTLDQRHTLFPNGTLYITKVVHRKKGNSDAGVYRCTLRNSYGAIVSRPANVQIAVMSREFSTDPDNTTALEGDIVRLTCSIDSIPPAGIAWHRDYQPLPHNKRYVTTDSGVLYIVNVKKEDSGNYRCQATNKVIKKSRESREGSVSVTQGSSQPSSIQFLPDSPPSVLILHEGHNSSLVCAAKGFPKPSLVWTHTRNGTNVTLQTTTNGLNLLKVNNVTRAHVGTYTCTAVQTFRDKVTSELKVLNVKVHSPPVIVQKPKSQVFPAAKTVRIECEVTGSPEPTVIWLKDAQKLNINGRIKQRSKELILGGVVTQDTGVYQCIAGNVWAAGRLVVNTSSYRPLPPEKLTCVPISPSQVNLTWLSLPQPHLMAFSIHYYPTNGGPEDKEVTQNRTFIVNKLEPYTNYTFYVRSYSRQAASEHSQKVTCSTGEAVPTGGPQVSVEATAPRCLLVSWLHPSASQARGAITQYKVQWKRANQSSINFETLPGTMTQYRITGLESGEEYRIRVIGATAQGWPDLDGKQAPWTNITMPRTRSSKLPPPRVHLNSLNSSSLMVKWSYPDFSLIDGFKLTYRPMGQEFKDTIKFPANTTMHLLTNLVGGSWYEVSVSAQRADVEGEACVESVLTQDPPPMASLPPLVDVEARSLSPTSIDITWSRPTYDITYYSVTFSPLNINSSGQTLETNVTRAQVAGLKPNTVYELVVVAHGMNHEISLNSSKLECRTLHEIAGVVEDMQWKMLTPNSAKISWKFMGKKSSITQYNVFYTSDVGAPQHKWQQLSVAANSNFIELSGLAPKTKYVVKVQAIAGGGPLISSPSFYFNTPSESGGANQNPPPTSNEPHKPQNMQPDQFLGILVGCGISLCCILLCTGTLLYKRKCVKYPRASSTNSNSQHPPCSAQHEMQSLTNLDVKYEVYKGEEGEGSRTTDEGDSLLSGPELELEGDETQLTIVDSSVAKDLVPDDGFHETTHNLLAPNG